MAHQPPPLARAGLLAGAVVVLQTLLVMWFAWPARQPAPHDLPIVVAGPAPATGAVVDHLRAGRPGAFDIRTAPDAATADAALRDRTAYAAFVVQPAGLSLHIASAAGPTVSAVLTQAVQQLGGGTPVPVVDVAPGPADDPRGAGFAAGFLPLLLTSAAAGAALWFAVRTRTARLAGLVAFAALAGLVASGVLAGLGVLSGPYLADAGVLALIAVAVAAAVCGLGSVLGPAGVGLGALLAFLLGNPISGLAGAPELLSPPWGAVGQLLPPGAGVTLLRSVAFFDGAGAGKAVAVLGSWAVVGLVLTVLGRQRAGAAAGVPERSSDRALQPA